MRREEIVPVKRYRRSFWRGSLLVSSGLVLLSRCTLRHVSRGERTLTVIEPWALTAAYALTFLCIAGLVALLFIAERRGILPWLFLLLLAPTTCASGPSFELALFADDWRISPAALGPDGARYRVVTRSLWLEGEEVILVRELGRSPFHLTLEPLDERRTTGEHPAEAAQDTAKELALPPPLEVGGRWLLFHPEGFVLLVEGGRGLVVYDRLLETPVWRRDVPGGSLFWPGNAVGWPVLP
jgi:hypothetical protein